jgi:N-hydroxyarylamine O-acetyltransferase
VPYENLAVQLRESAPLETASLLQRVLRGGRGGYCFENNTVLHALLTSLGFDVERRQGVVGERGDHAIHETNHMVLVVALGTDRLIADAGLGQGSLEPMELAEGTRNPGPFAFELERQQAGWWCASHPFSSFAGFWFSDAPARLEDFQPHHLRLSTSPESAFVQTLVVQRMLPDRILSLRARTLAVDGPGVRDRHLLGHADEFAAVLTDQFRIDADALGPERLRRLWALAEAQHDSYLRATTTVSSASTPDPEEK